MLILGKRHEVNDEPGRVGSIVNDGGIIGSELELNCSLEVIRDSIENYQKYAGKMANVALVPREDGLFLSASRDIVAGEELFFPYGTGFWLAHRREELLGEA